MKKTIVRYFKKDVVDALNDFTSKSLNFYLNNDNNIFYLKNSVLNPKKTILLTGGIHGNEPSGVLGLIENLNLIESLATQNNINLLIIPCINPSGFKLNTRENSLFEDINRSFFSSTPNIEAATVIKILKKENLNFDLSIDFHETCPEDVCDVTQGEILPTEFYLYEVCSNKKIRLGNKIVEKIKSLGFKTCQMPTIFGDTCIDGVISYPEASKNTVYASGTSLDLYLYNNKISNNSITIETIASYEMEDRLSQIKEILSLILTQ